MTTFSRMRILITGASGTIGAKLVPALEPEHELILLSRRAHVDPRYRQVDVCKIDQVIAATGEADGIIHLAIATGHEGERATTSTANASMPT
ncbi:MAG: NAD-dependent epimerase/dehydratase family protein [Candidatus Latescibacterota bacterium]|nr:NAD-dependent epimerase/dehydratase family protein [Candidatus Latescibacterota bacterium]